MAGSQMEEALVLIGSSESAVKGNCLEQSRQKQIFTYNVMIKCCKTSLLHKNGLPLIEELTLSENHTAERPSA
jgi:hypothetical protein